MRTTGWIQHNLLASTVTMADSCVNKNNNSSTYHNKWFFGLKLGAARKALIRWTEERYTGKDKKVCGNIYGHYLNYKIANILHETKRDGTQDFFEHFNIITLRNGFFFVAGCLFEGKKPLLEINEVL